MNDMSTPVTPSQPPASAHPKKTYRPPTLTLFGQVAALTQGEACSAANDGNGSCPSSGGSGMGMTGSDRRLKTGIVRIGAHPAGFGLYLFHYRPRYQALWGAGRQFGVMADEVAQVMPQAITRHPEGYQLVDYGMLGIRQHRH